jgi:hypothetical protein
MRSEEDRHGLASRRPLVVSGTASVEPFGATASTTRRGWRGLEGGGGTRSMAARQGRVLGCCLREEERGEEAKWNSAPAWQLQGDKDAARTWRRRLHGLHVGWRWRTVTKTTRCHHTRGRDTWPCAGVGHWQAGPATKSFSKISKPAQICNSIW